MTAAEIAQALGSARRSGLWWRCVCPVHGSRIGRSLTLALRDHPRGIAVRCHAGCSRDDVIAELRRLGLFSDGGAVPLRAPDPAEIERRRAVEQRERRRRIAEALYFWQHETDPVRPHSTVERYWMSRELELPIPSRIRASRSWLRHPEGGSRPAMVALVEHVTDGPVAIHRTWLAIDGSVKAAYREPRRGLGPVKGGAVRTHARRRATDGRRGHRDDGRGDHRDWLARLGRSFRRRDRGADPPAAAACRNGGDPRRQRRERARRTGGARRGRRAGSPRVGECGLRCRRSLEPISTTYCSPASMECRGGPRCRRLTVPPKYAGSSTWPRMSSLRRRARSCAKCRRLTPSRSMRSVTCSPMRRARSMTGCRRQSRLALNPCSAPQLWQSKGMPMSNSRSVAEALGRCPVISSRSRPPASARANATDKPYGPSRNTRRRCGLAGTATCLPTSMTRPPGIGHGRWRSEPAKEFGPRSKAHWMSLVRRRCRRSTRC